MTRGYDRLEAEYRSTLDRYVAVSSRRNEKIKQRIDLDTEILRDDQTLDLLYLRMKDTRKAMRDIGNDD